MNRPGSVDTRSDQQLVAALNRGELAAFDALYYRYRDWVVRLARRFTGNDEDALDVLQETFSYVFGKFPGFSLSARMTTFLYPVAKNLSIAVRRKRQRFVSEAELAEPAAPEGAADPRHARSELAAVLSALPESHREVLLMRFVDDLSLAEIAQALSIPTGTVKSRLHNAIAALREDERTRRWFEQSQ